MLWPYTWLLLLAMCGGPIDETCSQEHLENVKVYTKDKCMKIFQDEEKCTTLAGNRAMEVWQKCLQDLNN